MLQATTAVAALLVWGGVCSDAFLMPGGGGVPSEGTRPSSVRTAATMYAGPLPLAHTAAARTSTISAQLQSAPPPEGFEWGYDSSAAAADTVGADAGSSPEELLLKAIEALREQDLEHARELLAQARAECEHAGGPTDEQASLLELVTGRVSTAAAPRKQSRPPPAATSARPIGGAPTTGWDANLASDASAGDVIFPGTMAAPTGSSLIMPGWC